MKNKAIVFLKNRWKHKYIKYFLNEYSFVEVYKDSSAFSYSTDVDYFLWANDFENCFYKQHANKKNVFFIEDGFIRSIGLGADHIKPLSLVFDNRGIYYDSTVTSDLEQLILNSEVGVGCIERSKRLIRFLRSTNISKYNVGKSFEIDIPNNKKILLVVGQVESDSSIAKGSIFFKDNASLLKHVRKNNPNDFIVYKPHPDVVNSYRKGAFDTEGLCDLEVKDYPIIDLIKKVDEVHTITSLAGFEALIHRKTVFCYGLPFYAGWGLTNDFYNSDRRNKKINLETLTFFSLIKYPRYINDNGDRVEVEEVLNLLESKIKKGYQAKNVMIDIKRLYKKISLFFGKSR